MPKCLILIISLARATERRTHIIQELKKVGITNYTLIDAVDGQTLHENEINQYQIINKEPTTRIKHTPTEIACGLSHMRCYKLLLQSKAPAALILEDDAKLHADLPKIIQHINRFPKNWTITQAAHVFSTPKTNYWTRKHLIGKYTIGVNTLPSYGSKGYFISKDKAQQFVNDLPKLRLPADWFFFDTIRPWLTLYNCYQILPPPIRSSDLHQNSTLNIPPTAILPPRPKPWWKKLKRTIAGNVKVFFPPQQPY